MLDERELFSRNFQLDFLEELFLKEDCVYFYIEADSNVLENSFHVVYRPEEIILFQSLNDIIFKVARRSERCEIIGYNSFYASLKNEIIGCPRALSWSIPILIGKTLVNVVVRLKYIKDKNIYIGYYSPQISGEQAVLIANSYKDSLTGLFNRNTLNIHLTNLVKGDNVYGVMVDLDYFKQINDTYGHSVGNEVLTKVGKTFIDLANDDVIFYRTGGDEFFIQVHSTKEELESFLTKIQTKIREIEVFDRKVTCSMGAALYNDSCEDIPSLLNLCDLAMYKAKAAGRNQFCIL